MDWGTVGSAFAELFKGVAPAAGSAVARGLINQALPGEAASTELRGVDTRTGTGQAAEASRMRMLGRAEREYGRASKGKLNPREAYLLRKDQRAASAASGGLETGGHAVREMNALTDRAMANKKFWGGQVDSLSKGYTPLSVQKLETPAQPNMWGSILSEMAGAPAQKGFEGMLKSFAGPSAATPTATEDPKKKEARGISGPGGGYGI